MQLTHNFSTHNRHVISQANNVRKNHNLYGWHSHLYPNNGRTQVLQILANNKLLLHPKKCKFHQMKIEYLGVILSQDSVEADPTKIKEVAQWPKPWDKREVWQFLGFCNFYHRFIPGFAQITKPLTELIGKKEWK